MENFQFLTKAQFAALSSEDAAKYEQELRNFITQFKADNPTGISKLQTDILTFSSIPNNVGGNLRVALTVDEDDVPAEYRSLFVGQNDNTLLLSPGRADVFGRNSGFMGFAHMGISLNSAIDKGAVVLDVQLKVAGEEWTGKKNGQKTRGVYTHTHLAVVGLTYVPSIETSGRMAKITEAAAIKGFEAMMNIGAPQQTTTTSVNTPEVEEDNAVEA